MTEVPRASAGADESADIPTSATRWWAEGKVRAWNAYRAGAFHYLLAVLSVQGANYLAQLVIARSTKPEEFAVVRTVEAALSVALVVASLGMPMLAVTAVASLRNERDQGRVLGTLLMLCGATSILLSFGIAWTSRAFGPTVGVYLKGLVWVLCLSAISRTLLNYFQGRRQIQRLAAYTLLIAAVSFFSVVAAVHIWGLRGWVLGRYLGEGTALVLLIPLVWGTLRFTGPLPHGHSARAFARAGSGIAASLLLRAAADNAGLLMLGALGPLGPGAGFFSVSNLVFVALLVVPTSFGTLALPWLVERWGEPAAARRLARRVGTTAIGLSLASAIVVAVVARPLAATFLPDYLDAVPLLWVVLIAVPFRALGAQSGIVLVAAGRVYLTVIANLIGLVLIVGLCYVLVPPMGPAGAAWSVVAGEVAAAIFYFAAAGASLRTPQLHPTGGQTNA